MTEIRCPSAADYLEKRLDKLIHPEAGLLRLVMFDHDSPGLQRLRRQIAEALVLTIEREHEICRVVPEDD
jgi:hypothetical protein